MPRLRSCIATFGIVEWEAQGKAPRGGHRLVTQPFKRRVVGAPNGLLSRRELGSFAGLHNREHVGRQHMT